MLHSSSQTTAPTGSDGWTNALRPTYGHPWQGHMTMYPSPVPAGQQCPQAFVATPGLYTVPASRPGPRMKPLSRHQLGPTVSSQLFQLHGAPPRLLPRSRTGWRTPARRTTSLHQLVIFLLFVFDLIQSSLYRCR
jgi:hypothetical protein